MHEGAVDFDSFFTARMLDFEHAGYEHTQEIMVPGQDIERTSVVGCAHTVGLAFEVHFERRIDFDRHGRLTAGLHSWF